MCLLYPRGQQCLTPHHKTKRQTFFCLFVWEKKTTKKTFYKFHDFVLNTGVFAIQCFFLKKIQFYSMLLSFLIELKDIILAECQKIIKGILLVILVG